MPSPNPYIDLFADLGDDEEEEKNPKNPYDSLFADVSSGASSTGAAYEDDALVGADSFAPPPVPSNVASLTPSKTQARTINVNLNPDPNIDKEILKNRVKQAGIITIPERAAKPKIPVANLTDQEWLAEQLAADEQARLSKQGQAPPGPPPLIEDPGMQGKVARAAMAPGQAVYQALNPEFDDTHPVSSTYQNILGVLGVAPALVSGVYKHLTETEENEAAGRDLASDVAAGFRSAVSTITSPTKIALGVGTGGLHTWYNIYKDIHDAVPPNPDKEGMVAGIWRKLTNKVATLAIDPTTYLIPQGTVGKILGAVFLPGIIEGAAEGYSKAGQEASAGNYKKAIVEFVDPVVDTMFAGLITKHLTTSSPKAKAWLEEYNETKAERHAAYLDKLPQLTGAALEILQQKNIDNTALLDRPSILGIDRIPGQPEAAELAAPPALPAELAAKGEIAPDAPGSPRSDVDLAAGTSPLPEPAAPALEPARGLRPAPSAMDPAQTPKVAAEREIKPLSDNQEAFGITEQADGSYYNYELTPEHQARVAAETPTHVRVRTTKPIEAYLPDKVSREIRTDQLKRVSELEKIWSKSTAPISIYPHIETVGNKAKVTQIDIASRENSQLLAATNLDDINIKVPDNLVEIAKKLKASNPNFATPAEKAQFMSWWNSVAHEATGGHVNGIGARIGKTPRATGAVKAATSRLNEVMSRLRVTHTFEDRYTKAGAAWRNKQRATPEEIAAIIQIAKADPTAIKARTLSGRALSVAELNRGIMDAVAGNKRSGVEYGMEAVAVKRAVRELLKSPDFESRFGPIDKIPEGAYFVRKGDRFALNAEDVIAQRLGESAKKSGLEGKEGFEYDAAELASRRGEGLGGRARAAGELPKPDVGRVFEKDAGAPPEIPAEGLLRAQEEAGATGEVGRGTLEEGGGTQVRPRVNELIPGADAARLRIQQAARGTSPSIGIDPKLLADHLLVGADFIARGTRDFAKWSAKMVEEFGDSIKPHLEDLFRGAKEKYILDAQAEPAGPPTRVQARTKSDADLFASTPKYETSGNLALKPEAAPAPPQLGQAIPPDAPPPTPPASLGGPAAPADAPLPKYTTTSINLEQMSKAGKPEDFVRMIHQIAETNKATMEASAPGKGKSFSVEEREANADAVAARLEITRSAVLKMELGNNVAFNEFQIAALRQVMENADNAVIKQAADNTKQTDPKRQAEGYTELLRKLAEATYIQAIANGKANVASRALGVHAFINKQLKTGYGASGVVETYTPEMLEQLNRAITETGAHDFITRREVAKAALMPTTAEHLYFAWVNGILSGPKTQLVNFASTAMMLPLYPIETLLQAGVNASAHGAHEIAPRTLEMLFGKATKDNPKYDRRIYATEAGIQAISMFTGATDGAKAGLLAWTKGLGAFDPATRKFLAAGDKGIPTEMKEGFSQLQKDHPIIGLPVRTLTAVDTIFKTIIYRMAHDSLLYRALRNEKGPINLETLAAKISQADIKAQEIALYRTFNAPVGKLGTWLNDGRKKWPILRYIMPFVQTPINIIEFGLERSGIAPIWEVAKFAGERGVRGASAIKRGAKTLKDKMYDDEVAELEKTVKAQADGKIPKDKVTQVPAWTAMAKLATGEYKIEQFSEETAKQLLGTLVMLATVSYAADGTLSGAGPDNSSEFQTRRSVGWDPYTVRQPGKFTPYGRMEPIATSVGATVDFISVLDTIKAGDKSTLPGIAETGGKAFLQALGVIKKNALDKSSLSGLSGFINTLNDGKRYGPSYFYRLFGSLVIPAFIQQGAQASDTTRRKPSSLLQSLESKLPGFQANADPALDIKGQPFKNEHGFWSNFLSPVQSRTATNDPVINTMIKNKVFKLAPSGKLTRPGPDPDQLDKPGDELPYKLTDEERITLASAKGALGYFETKQEIADGGLDGVQSQRARHRILSRAWNRGTNRVLNKAKDLKADDLPITLDQLIDEDELAALTGEQGFDFSFLAPQQDDGPPVVPDFAFGMLD